MCQSTDEDLKVKEKNSKSVKEKKSKSVKEKILMNLNLLSTPKKRQLSRQAEQAIETLEQGMSDLKGSEVALFLEEKFHEPLKDHSHWKRKKIRSKRKRIHLGDAQPAPGTDAGVYLWECGSRKHQYVGSTINQSNRFFSHVHGFTDNSAKKTQAMHKWVKKHKNAHLCRWQPLYNTPNFLELFIQSHPGYELSAEELLILKLATEIYPRILEQELFDHYAQTKFNIQKTVHYSFLHLKKTDPLYSLIDAKTRMPIRNFCCRSEARYTLGIENQFTIKKMVEQNTIIQTKFYSFPVLLVSLAPIYPDSPFPVTTPDL